LESEESGSEADAEERWERRFRMFGTTIM
jgi:hypothetical protein